jgi:hypothetical protein
MKTRKWKDLHRNDVIVVDGREERVVFRHRTRGFFVWVRTDHCDRHLKGERMNEEVEVR